MTCGQPDADDKDWGEWRNFVLKEIERLNNNLEIIRTRQEDMRNEITKLKTEIYTTAIIISVAVPIAISVIIWFIEH